MTAFSNTETFVWNIFGYDKFECYRSLTLYVPHLVYIYAHEYFNLGLIIQKPMTKLISCTSKNEFYIFLNTFNTVTAITKVISFARFSSYLQILIFHFAGLYYILFIFMQKFNCTLHGKNKFIKISLTSQPLLDRALHFLNFQYF